MRPWLIGFLGLLLGAGGGGALYYRRVAAHRGLEQACGPELVWIKQEFKLNDGDFQRVRVLHEAYKPVCVELCRKVDEKYRELTRLLAASTNVTPEMDRVLAESGVLRGRCQAEMLKHFFQISQAMPPEQGRRYLAWMQSQTLAPTHPTMVPRVGKKPPDDGSAH